MKPCTKCEVCEDGLVAWRFMAEHHSFKRECGSCGYVSADVSADHVADQMSADDVASMGLCIDSVIPRAIRDMSEAQLRLYMSSLIRYIDMRTKDDVIGAMLILFQDGGEAGQLSQYAATVDPATVPEGLRELASRLENRDFKVREADPIEDMKKATDAN